ncbi:hypothetical protein D3C78_273030 [compost metagenome]
MRVGQRQALQLLRQWAAQQDSQRHAADLVITQGCAEVSQQPLNGLLIHKVISHQILVPLGIALGCDLQGTKKLIAAQAAGITEGWLVERSFR